MWFTMQFTSGIAKVSHNTPQSSEQTPLLCSSPVIVKALSLYLYFPYCKFYFDDQLVELSVIQVFFLIIYFNKFYYKTIPISVI